MSGHDYTQRQRTRRGAHGALVRALVAFAIVLTLLPAMGGGWAAAQDAATPPADAVAVDQSAAVATDTPTPTDVPTEAPTDTPTAIPTNVPTEAPTDAPTVAPTDVPTEASTDAPATTEAPAETATATPTAAPSETVTDTPTAKAASVQSAAPTGTPTIVSDKPDYGPGELVTLTGDGWQPGETVHIFVNDDAGSSWSRNVDVTADANGAIVDSFNLPNWFVAVYTVKATGSVSGQVTYTFTDTNVKVQNAATTPSNVGATFKVEDLTEKSITHACDSTYADPNPATATVTGPNQASANLGGAGPGDLVRITATAVTTGYTLGSISIGSTSVPATNGVACWLLSNGDFNSGTATFIVSYKQNQTIAFATLANKTFGDAPFTVSATASSGLAVTFTVTGNCTVSGSTVTITGAGSCTVTAAQAGDATFNPALSVAQSFSIAKAGQTITFNPPASVAANAQFTVTATSTSGLTVTIAASGTCTISGSTVNTTTGDCVLTASQGGNANYNAAPNVVRTVSAGKQNQTITFAAISNKTYGDADFNPGATASSGLAVSYAVGASDACTIASGKVHLTGAGSCTVTASQAGDATYNAATSVQQSFTIAPKPVVITPISGQSKTFGVTDPTLTFTNDSGLAGTAFTGALSRLSGENVGSYAITIGNLTAGTNYSLSLSTTTIYFTINPGSVTVAANQPSVTVNEGQTATNTGTYSNPGVAVALSASVGTITDTGNGTWSWSYGTTDGAAQGQMVTITAKANSTPYTTTFNLVVNNVAPTATLGNNGPVNEGSPVTISFTSPADPSSVDAASLHYAFDCNGNTLASVTYAGAGSSASTTCTFPDNGAAAKTVNGRIIDKDGGFTDYATAVTVNDVAPVVTAATNQTATAGTEKSFTLGSFADPGADNPWSATVNWGDGTSVTTISNIASAGTIPAQLHTFAAGGTFTVTVTVTDKVGVVSNQPTFTVKVDPTITLTLSTNTVSFNSINPTGADFQVANAVTATVASSNAGWTGACSISANTGDSGIPSTAVSWKINGSASAFTSFVTAPAAPSSGCFASSNAGATAFTYDYQIHVNWTDAPGSFSATVTYSVQAAVIP